MASPIRRGRRIFIEIGRRRGRDGTRGNDRRLLDQHIAARIVHLELHVVAGAGEVVPNNDPETVLTHGHVRVHVLVGVFRVDHHFAADQPPVVGELLGVDRVEVAEILSIGRPNDDEVAVFIHGHRRLSLRICRIGVDAEGVEVVGHLEIGGQVIVVGGGGHQGPNALEQFVRNSVVVRVGLDSRRRRRGDGSRQSPGAADLRQQRHRQSRIPRYVKHVALSFIDRDGYRVRGIVDGQRLLQVEGRRGRIRRVKRDQGRGPQRRNQFIGAGSGRGESEVLVLDVADGLIAPRENVGLAARTRQVGDLGGPSDHEAAVGVHRHRRTGTLVGLEIELVVGDFRVDAELVARLVQDGRVLIADRNGHVHLVARR